MEEVKNIYLPKWASIFYGLLAVALIPWIIILAEYLPARHLARHWDALWVGFDIMILLTIIITLYFVMVRKIWVIISASALASLLLVDAWFDILTARPGKEQTQSFIMGFVEVILSILTYRMVYLVIHQSGRHKDVRLKTSKQPT